MKPRTKTNLLSDYLVVGSAMIAAAVFPAGEAAIYQSSETFAVMPVPLAEIRAHRPVPKEPNAQDYISIQDLTVSSTGFVAVVEAK